MEQEIRKMSTTPEIVDTKKGTKIRGYFALYNVKYSMGWYDEILSPGCFDKTDFTDVRVLFNHNADLILGRTKAKTATIGFDANGGWYECLLPDSPNGHNTREAIKRGDVTQSSWGFVLNQDGTSDVWTTPNANLGRNRPLRTIVDVPLIFDASPVCFAANPETDVSADGSEMEPETDAKRADSVRPPTSRNNAPNSDKARLEAAIREMQIMSADAALTASRKRGPTPEEKRRHLQQRAELERIIKEVGFV